jgi:hypothetical protein
MNRAQNTVSNSTPIVVCLPIRFLEKGSSIVARVPFCGNVFTWQVLAMDISSDYTIPVSGVMSQTPLLKSVHSECPTDVPPFLLSRGLCLQRP